MIRFWCRSELPALLFLAALLFLFFPAAATFQGFFFVGDLLQQFYPYLTYSFDRILHEGQWPLWTDQIRLGYPLFAEGQTGLLFPTSWFYLFVPPAMAFSAIVLSNVFLAAVGMYGFVRSQTPLLLEQSIFSRSAALVAAVVYAYSGRFLISIVGVSDMRVLAALPWCLWAVARLFESPTLGQTATCALVLSLLGLAGKPDVALLASLVLLIFAASLAHSHTSTLPHFHVPTHRFPRSLLLFFLAVALALALSAVQWLPTLELLAQSVRREPVPLERWIAGSLSPQQILGFLTPELFGNPYDGTYIGGWSFLYLELYLGPVLGVLMVLGGFVADRKARRLWGGLAVAGLVLSLGEHLPGYALLHKVPLLGQSRVPSRWLHLTLLGVAVLAAHGTRAIQSLICQSAENIQDPRFRNSKPVLLAVGAIATLLLLAAFVAFGQMPNQFPDYAFGGTTVTFSESTERAALLAAQRRLGWLRALFMLALATAILLPTVRVSNLQCSPLTLRRWAVPALLLLMVLDQRLHLGDLSPTQPASVYEPSSPVIEFLQRHSSGSRFYSHRSHVPAYYLARTRLRRGTEAEVVADFYRHVTSNCALIAGLNDASGYGELAYANRPEPDLSPAGLKTLTLWGVRFVITRPEEVPPGYKAVFQSGGAAVFEIRPENISEHGIQAEPSVIRHLSSAISHSPSAVIFDSLSFRLGLALSLFGVLGVAGICGRVVMRSAEF